LKARQRHHVLHLRSREGGSLLCPECKTSYSVQAVAQQLPEIIFKEFIDTVVARRVEKETEALARQFDDQLNGKVEELINDYGNIDTVTKRQALTKAKNARDTIMNLACPHCNTYYSEFSGCMALMCATCQGHFCGYCHDEFVSAAGAHQHVRECLMKKFLRKEKKNIQNAIVIELTQDLLDIGIQPEALFEFGNLHHELGIAD
jgi:protein-arginine kinase activator protein McsA